MGVENNECVIATTWSSDAIEDVKQWTLTLSEREQSLFSFVPSLANSKQTVFLGPDGGKKGWSTAAQGEALREKLIAKLASFEYEDGSSPFNWVEVGYGEFGQMVLRGNCRNMYSEGPYHT